MPSINRQRSMKDAMVAREDMEDAKYQTQRSKKDAMVAREDMEDAKYQPPKKYERGHGSQGRYGGCQVSTAK